MLRLNSPKVWMLLASLALAGGGIALMSTARNSPVRKLTPLPGVQADGSVIDDSGARSSGSSTSAGGEDGPHANAPEAAGVAPSGQPRSGQPKPAAPKPGPSKPAAPPATTPATAPASGKVPDDIQWRADFETGLQEARASGKLMMVDFYTDWCGYCKKMDSTVFSDFGVIAESMNFVSVKVNAEKHSALAAKYQVSGFPTIIWMDGSGAPVETLPGYADAPEFLQIMRNALSKSPNTAT